jgi:23S rRNA (adenine2503-C2)-methyltransferase
MVSAPKPARTRVNEQSNQPRRHVLGEDLPALRQWLLDAGQPGYRADQILDWVYHKRAETFAQMTNLAKALRTWLTERADVYCSHIVAQRESVDGTRKLLLAWPDEQTTETVWVPEPERHTACLSAQVGCPVGCGFCASGLDGLLRNLTAGEIVEQALRIAGLVAASAASGTERDARLSNVVFMGTGEPLANYDAVVRAIRILNAPWGLGIGARRITLSTVGLPRQIRRLADEGLQLNLAVSLHAPEQKLRQRLVPWGKVPLTELLDACRYYFEQTGREITLEYVLLDGVNMEQQHAAELAKIARRLRCNVNLLRYNPAPGLPYGRPSSESAYTFQRELRKCGVNAHLRTSRGQDIEAACGQLRRRLAAESNSDAGPAYNVQRKEESERRVASADDMSAPRGEGE